MPRAGSGARRTAPMTEPPSASDPRRAGWVARVFADDLAAVDGAILTGRLAHARGAPRSPRRPRRRRRPTQPRPVLLASGDVDVVYVCTPPHRHAEDCLQSLAPACRCSARSRSPTMPRPRSRSSSGPPGRRGLHGSDVDALPPGGPGDGRHGRRPGRRRRPPAADGRLRHGEGVRSAHRYSIPSGWRRPARPGGVHRGARRDVVRRPRRDHLGLRHGAPASTASGLLLHFAGERLAVLSSAVADIVDLEHRDGERHPRASPVERTVTTEASGSRSAGTRRTDGPTERSDPTPVRKEP